MSDRRTHTVSVVLDAAGIARALRTPAYQLRVAKGPNKGLRKRSAASRLVIGSHDGADLVLTDPTVSAVHCEIVADQTGFKVRDLGAKNGVLLDGRRIQEAWLNPADDLLLGETLLKFKALEESEDQALAVENRFGGLRGSSIAMRRLYQQLRKAAASSAPVLICGETGTGKELAADALVAEGPRKEAPLVVVECAAMGVELAESHLFGHEAGAFTGAGAAHIGAFERAHGGTLLLDEVGELPLDLQPKLLGALERKSIQRVGGVQPRPVDVRVIATTSRELERDVNAGTFRADLFYRLAVLMIRAPPLRDRREDIPELVAHFLDDLPFGSRPAPAALQRLYQADYPGNVRELRSAVERAVVGLEPPAAASPASVDLETPFHVQKSRIVDGFERAYLSRLLDACGGNVSETARRAGITRVHLYALLQRLGIPTKRS
jgi:two-component system response regulator GlrR